MRVGSNSGPSSTTIRMPITATGSPTGASSTTPMDSSPSRGMAADITRLVEVPYSSTMPPSIEA